MRRERDSFLSRTHYTETASGTVRHLSWITPYGELLLPVALRADPAKPGTLLHTPNGMPFARKVGSKFVYVLPGGREVLP